jgi:hypothetical protein
MSNFMWIPRNAIDPVLQLPIQRATAAPTNGSSGFRVPTIQLALSSIQCQFTGSCYFKVLDRFGLLLSGDDARNRHNRASRRSHSAAADAMRSAPVKICLGSTLMKMSGFTIAVLGSLLSPTIATAQGTPAAAATSQPLVAGSTVYDPQGGEVGKIDSVAGDNVVLDTGTSKATLLKSAFGTSPKGPTVNATKAQIDSMVAAASAKTNAALDAALVPGAQVFGKAGNLIGTVKSVEGGQVVLDRAEGPVSLTRQAFALTSGRVTISMTAAELDAAAKAATPQ